MSMSKIVIILKMNSGPLSKVSFVILDLKVKYDHLNRFEIDLHVPI